MIQLFMHAGSGNHGCEAIVRSTHKLLQQPLNLHSSQKEQDIKYGLNQFCNIFDDLDKTLKKGGKDWFWSSVETKVTGKIDLQVCYRRKELLSKIKADDICMSIGGDNYCYPGTDIMAALNSNIKKKRAKLVLWGCSIEPELLNDSVVASDMQIYDLITAREAISYDAIKKVNPNTVLVSDPAFVMDRIDLPLPSGWREGKMIGINASPLVLRNGKNKSIVLEAYKNLVECILKNTDFGIALIPHVVWDNNDDRKILKVLYDEFQESGRIVLLDDCNCMQLKGYIARCRLFIGARTHSTIAAYSTCVPTLVLGYSVKARGIAQDIFGTYDKYVLPVQELSSEYALADGFRWLLENEFAIRRHLNEIMPSYIQRAYIAVEAFKRL